MVVAASSSRMDFETQVIPFEVHTLAQADNEPFVPEILQASFLQASSVTPSIPNHEPDKVEKLQDLFLDKSAIPQTPPTLRSFRFQAALLPAVLAALAFLEMA